MTRGTALCATLALLAATAAGCGSGGSSGSHKAAKDIHVAFVAAASNLDFASEMADGARYAGQQFGVDVQVLAPNQVDGPAQVTLFQTAIRTARDGVVVATLTPDLFTRPVSRAIGEGVPVLAADNPLPKESGVTTFVGNSNTAAGRLLADTALAKVPAGRKGPVVLGVPTPGVPVLEARAAGMKAEIQAKRPDLPVLGPYDSKQNPNDSYAAWNNLVRANPNAVAYLDAGDPASVSLPRIRSQNHGDYVVGAFDLDEGGLAAVKAGTETAVVDPQHWLKGYLTTRLLIDKARGTLSRIPHGWWDNGAALVTQSNVDQIIARQKSRQARASWYRGLADEQYRKLTHGALPPISRAS